MANNNNHGGKRPGAGRPSGIRKHIFCVRLSEKSYKRLEFVDNKASFVDWVFSNHWFNYLLREYEFDKSIH